MFLLNVTLHRINPILYQIMTHKIHYSDFNLKRILAYNANARLLGWMRLIEHLLQRVTLRRWKQTPTEILPRVWLQRDERDGGDLLGSSCHTQAGGLHALMGKPVC